MTMTLFICSPQTVTFRRYLDCPICETRRRFVLVDATWWGRTLTCCGCGDSWDTEEGRMPRPFARGWRAEAVRKAKRLWNEAPSRAEAEQTLRELLEAGL